MGLNIHAIQSTLHQHRDVLSNYPGVGDELVAAHTRRSQVRWPSSLYATQKLERAQLDFRG